MKPPSNGNSNGTDWATAFSSFHDRHRGKDGKKLKFTGVFNAHMDAFMMEADVPLAWRVLAWTWRYAWGNNSDFCVDKIAGERIGQTRCAADLKVEKQRISDEVVFLRGLNFIRPNTGYKLYPVDDPLQEPQESAHPEDPRVRPLADSQNPRVRPLADFQAFCEEWRVRSLADSQELQSAEDTVKRLKIIRLGQYRKWRNARRARTLAGASLIQPFQPLEHVAQGRNESVGRYVAETPEGPNEAPTYLPTPPAPPPEPPPTEVIPDPRRDPLFVAMVGVVEAVAVPVIGESPTDAQYVEIHNRLNGAAPEHFQERLETKKRQGKLNSVMVLVHLADDCAETKHKWKPPTKARVVGKKSFVESVTEEAARRLAKWGHL